MDPLPTTPARADVLITSTGNGSTRRDAWQPPPGRAESFLPADLRAMLAALRRHVWVIAGLVAGAVLVAGYVGFLRQRLYRANAVIRIVDTRRAVAGKLGDEDEGRVGETADPFFSQLEVLRSRAVLGEVVDSAPILRLDVRGLAAGDLGMLGIAPDASADTIRLSFTSDSVLAAAGTASAAAPYGSPLALGGVRFAVAARPPEPGGRLVVRGREAAIGSLASQLRLQPRENTDVADVYFEHADPRVAQAVANRTVTVFQSRSADDARARARYRRQFLESQLDGAARGLAAARGALERFRGTQHTVSARDRLAAGQSGLGDLQVRREELAAERRVYGEMLATLEKAGSAPDSGAGLQAALAVPGMAVNPVVASLYEQLVRYQASRDSLLGGRWGTATSHPDVVRLTNLIGATQGQLVRVVRGVVTSLDVRLRALDALRAQNAEALQRLSAAESEETALTESFESSRRLADELQGELQKARLEEAVQAGPVEVLDLAPLPTSPEGLGGIRVVLIGLFGGLLLGVAVSLVLEYLNTAILRGPQLESVLPEPGIVVIPPMPRGPRTRLLRRSGSAGGHSSTGRSAGHVRRRSRAPEHSLVMLTAPLSPAAEAFRGLRTRLVFHAPDREFRVLAVTSPMPRDGKTTVAANLAISFAQLGRPVLLVDADLRKPMLHRLFGATTEPGLAALLSRRARLEEVVRATGVPHLFVLPAGRTSGSPNELLGDGAMRDLLESLRRDFEIVIFDTPPLLAAADALVLGAVVDGSLLVVRAGRTTHDLVCAALRQLSDLRVPLAGAVLNDPDAKVKEAGGYYSYYAYAESGSS
ncbi:MAG TPA: polysaccharide biosynthesis tyrosine autokinase [Longimicrobiales bacterium]|nr:polysaccharide biosynthesis tyrosine autokinase [Longimicrobiales bacterium]